MKTNLAFLASVLLAFTTATVSQGRITTITVQNYNGITNETAEVVIEAYELAEVLTLKDNSGGGITRVSLTVFKDGTGTEVLPAPWTASYQPILVAGPARLRLGVSQGYAVGFCTIKITPESYPVDKSILVPPGAGGAAISLESSTDLVNWTSATNGVYTNLPAAKFFRIRADRIP